MSRPCDFLARDRERAIVLNNWFSDLALCQSCRGRLRTKIARPTRPASGTKACIGPGNPHSDDHLLLSCRSCESCPWDCICIGQTKKGVCKLDGRTGSAVLCRFETNLEGWAANMQAGLTARTEDTTEIRYQVQSVNGTCILPVVTPPTEEDMSRNVWGVSAPKMQTDTGLRRTRRSAGPPPCVVMRTENSLFPLFFLMAGVSMHQPPPGQPS